MSTLKGEKINNLYLVEKYLGQGSFGTLYTGSDTKTQEPVAIKAESKDAKEPQLPLEYRFYRLLGHQKGIPKVHYFGPCGLYMTMVLDMLGPNLDKMHKLCNRKFSVDTTAKIAAQLISLMESVHSKNIIFRDVKPANFLLGRADTPQKNMVHIIDFGLAKEYIDPGTNAHIPFKTGKPLLGTPRYMSVWSHQGYEQSRRDDMESIGFMIIYFIKGHLPWMKMKGHGQERYRKIGKIKKDTSLEQLCNSSEAHMTQFYQYMIAVRGLQFPQEPNYEKLRQSFESIASERVEYDWEAKRRKTKDKITDIVTITSSTTKLDNKTTVGKPKNKTSPTKNK